MFNKFGNSTKSNELFKFKEEILFFNVKYPKASEH